MTPVGAVVIDTVPVLITAMSPDTGTPVGDQSEAVLNEALDPFQVLVAMRLSPSSYRRPVCLDIPSQPAGND